MINNPCSTPNLKIKLFLPLGIIITLLILLASLSWVFRPGKAEKIMLMIEPNRLVADGRAKTTLILRAQDGSGRGTVLRGQVAFEVFSQKGVLTLSSGQVWNSNRREVRTTATAGVQTGTAEVVVRMDGLISDTVTLETIPDYEDRNKDGFPDVAQLAGEQDKERFREWLASTQVSTVQATPSEQSTGVPACWRRYGLFDLMSRFIRLPARTPRS